MMTYIDLIDQYGFRDRLLEYDDLPPGYMPPGSFASVSYNNRHGISLMMIVDLDQGEVMIAVGSGDVFELLSEKRITD